MHKIAFEVTHQHIYQKPPFILAERGGVLVGLDRRMIVGNPVVMTEPRVTIKLDSSCPRKPQCARNHIAGWLQTITENIRSIRYTHTLVTENIPLPIRDIMENMPESERVFPFYGAVQRFDHDGDTLKIAFDDSPFVFAEWDDKYITSPLLIRSLRRLMLYNRFNSWLVVQNLEWARAHPRDPAAALAYQKHFSWMMKVVLDIDRSQPKLVDRIRHHDHRVEPDPMADGKGAEDPMLTAPVAFQSVTEGHERMEWRDDDD